MSLTLERDVPPSRVAEGEGLSKLLHSQLPLDALVAIRCCPYGGAQPGLSKKSKDASRLLCHLEIRQCNPNHPFILDSNRDPRMLNNLNSDNAYIFRITHIQNISWILRNGLHCRNSEHADPEFVSIGNPDLISKRGNRPVPIEPGGTLSDYIPFYFTPFSPMLYNIITGYRDIRQYPSSDIAIMVSSLRHLSELDTAAVYTDRHAYLSAAKFFSSLDNLDQIAWGPLQHRDFKRDVDDPDKIEKYQAEALVHRHLPVDHLLAILCYRDNEKVLLEERRDELGVNITISVNQGWYF